MYISTFRNNIEEDITKIEFSQDGTWKFVALDRDDHVSVPDDMSAQVGDLIDESYLRGYNINSLIIC